jgi:hypothetical protein
VNIHKLQKFSENFFIKMVNKILTISSILMAVINVKYNFKPFYIFGTLTSILNHSTSIESFKLLDRSVMVFGTFFDFYFTIKSKELFIYQIVSILSFFTTKKTGNVIFHLNAHLFITYLHFKINNVSY